MHVSVRLAVAALLAILPVTAFAQPALPPVEVLLPAANSLSADEPYFAGPQALAFSANARQLAAGDNNGIIRIWSVADGRLLRVIRHPPAVTALRFLPDGRLLTASGTIRLWDIETGRLVQTMEDVFRASAALAVSPDGLRVVAGGDTALVRQWEIASGRRSGEYIKDILDPPAAAIDLSPDRQLIAIARQDGIISLWNAENAELVRRFEGEGSGPPVTVLRFSADGKRLLTAGEGGLSEWDVASGRQTRTHNLGSAAVLAFWSDGKRARLCCGDTAASVDLVSGAVTRPTLPELSFPTAAAFSADGATLAITGIDGELRLVDAETGKPIKVFNPRVATTILSARLTANAGTLVAGEAGRHVQIWDLTTATLRRRLELAVERIHSLSLSLDGRRLLASDGQKSVLLDLASGRTIRDFVNADDDFAPVHMSPDGRFILAASPKGTSRALWSTETGQLLRSLDGLAGPISYAGFSANSEIVAVHSGTRIGFFDTVSGHLRRTVTGLGEFDRVLGLSPDARRMMIAGAPEVGVRMWDVQAGRPIAGVRYPDASFYTFGPDNGRLLAQAIEEIQLVDTATGRPVVAAPGEIPFEVPAAFLPDGRTWLAGSYDTTLTLRDSGSGATVRSFIGHTGAVIALDLTADGQRAVTGSPDTTLRVWNIATGELLATMLATAAGEWAILTPEGFYNASPRGAELMNVIAGLEAYPLPPFAKLLHRPDLVVEKIAGDPRGRVRSEAAMLALPAALAAARRDR